jgi:hypothetical protein
MILLQEPIEPNDKFETLYFIMRIFFDRQKNKEMQYFRSAQGFGCVYISDRVFIYEKSYMITVDSINGHFTNILPKDILSTDTIMIIKNMAKL